MKAGHPAPEKQQNRPIQIDRRSAYHQAGHAAAIYLGNKQKQLPAVHFQIVLQDKEALHGAPENQGRGIHLQRLVKVEGGRLIQSLPLLKTASINELTVAGQMEYRLAYEADIVNILAGPLSEAKYVAMRDNKVFNPNLVYLGEPRFYGGKAELDIVNEYLECVVNKREERDQKLAELFLLAYSFINAQANWLAITALAVHILEQHHKAVLDCNDVIALLESSRLAAA